MTFQVSYVDLAHFRDNIYSVISEERQTFKFAEIKIQVLK